MRYFRPGNLEQYFKHMETVDPSRTTILAGGTDLMPGYEQGRALPEYLIDVKSVPELCGVVERDTEVEIGALTSIESLKRSATIRRHFPALAMAADNFAGVQIRHRATIGGNIVNASPAGDTLPPLYAFDASLKIAGPDTERTIPIEDFIQGPGKVDLGPLEVLQSIILPKHHHQSTFYKLGLRRAMAVAVVSFALVYEQKGRSFSHLAVAAGAVAPGVVYLSSLVRTALEDTSTLDSAMDLVDKDIAPIDDLRATADYRRTVLKNVLRHALGSLLEGRR